MLSHHHKFHILLKQNNENIYLWPHTSTKADKILKSLKIFFPVSCLKLIVKKKRKIVSQKYFLLKDASCSKIIYLIKKNFGKKN